MNDAFQTLAWDDHLGWWSGTPKFAPGHPVELHVRAANTPAALGEAFGTAAPAWERLKGSEPDFRAAVAAQLVDAHNDLCDPEDEVAPERFAARLRLLSVLFDRGGGLELTFSDGMLLGGHRIVLPVDADGGVCEAYEVG